MSFLCPRCRATLPLSLSSSTTCATCAEVYPRLGGVPVLLADANAHLAQTARAVVELQEHAVRAAEALRGSSNGPDLLPMTASRLRQQASAIEQQAEDIRRLLVPVEDALQTMTRRPDDAGRGVAVSDGTSVLLAHLQHLYRDWGWPAAVNDEALATLRVVRDLAGGRPMGKTWMPGAGACRLAYDVHLQEPTAEIVAMDIDPLVLCVADLVLGGATVPLLEVNAEPSTLDAVATEWALHRTGQAPHEPRLRLLLADALDPPLAAGSFDTVITAWFIDLVPPDLRGFVSVVWRMLKPGGVWLNVGPLRYADHTSASSRFTHDEVLEWLGRAGFLVSGERTATRPYLVSPQTGRGRMERVFAWSATRSHETPRGGTSPDWLVLAHLPIPLPTRGEYSTHRAAARILFALIDGTASTDDVAEQIGAMADQRPSRRAVVEALQEELRLHYAQGYWT